MSVTDQDIYLNDVDKQILQDMEDYGRTTTGLMADLTGKSESYISKRLRRLREHGIVSQVRKGVYDLPENAEEYKHSIED